MCENQALGWRSPISCRPAEECYWEGHEKRARKDGTRGKTLTINDSNFPLIFGWQIITETLVEVIGVLQVIPFGMSINIFGSKQV